MNLQCHGFEVWKNCLTPTECALARARLLSIFDEFKGQLKYRPDLHALCEDDDSAMWQFSLRWNRRFEIGLSPDECPELALSAVLLEKVRRVHQDYRLVSVGAIISLPEDKSASPQPWHRDCDPSLLAYKYAPPQWLTLFVALENIDSRNGSPEFACGSHTKEFHELKHCEVVRQDVAVGSVIAHAMRVIHRGMSNTSNCPRVLGMLVFSRLKQDSPRWTSKKKLLSTQRTVVRSSRYPRRTFAC